MYLPRFDELHVISDLHMGGKPGFQILRETKRLEGYIRWVTAQRPEGRVTLVLNGDIFDTLAEDIGGYIALDNAEQTIDRIMKDVSFVGIWQALKDLVATEQRRLVFVLGNHDLELAFPNVQRLVTDFLAGDSDAVRGRIEFSTAGVGFACWIGNARVYCTHGNEVDAWNFVKYEQLSKAARRLSAAKELPIDDWQPNAGTKLVRDIMNRLKLQYPWVDLLKPENSVVVGILLILNPAIALELDRIVPIASELAKGSANWGERLSASTAANAGNPYLQDSLLGPNLSAALGTTRGATARELLTEAEQTYKEADAVQGPDAQLGLGSYIVDRITGLLRGISKVEALRRAVKDWLKDDDTFKPGVKDDTYNAVMQSVGYPADFVIAGHTHLERAIRDDLGRVYFNSGTWIRLLQIRNELLADEAAFKPCYDALVTRARDSGPTGQTEFEAAATQAGMIVDRTSAVRILVREGRTCGELHHILGDGFDRELVGETYWKDA